MILKIALILTICFCKAASLLLKDVPYVVDEKVEQSIVYKTEEFQFEMADLLGLTDRPRRIRRPLSLRKSASQFLLELYNSLKEDEEPHLSAFHNRVVRSTLISKEDRTEIEKCNNIVTFSSKKRGNAPSQSGSEMALTFNTNHVPQDLELVRAELRIFQNSRLGRQFECEQNITVTVFRRFLNRKLQKIDEKLLNSFTTSTNYKGWLVANVTKTLSKWLRKGYHPNGHDLIVSTSLTGSSNEAGPEQFVTPDDIGLINMSGTEEYQPFVIGYFNGPELMSKIQHLRFKRDMGRRKEYLGPKPEAGQESYKILKTCERMNFSIDFKDLQMQDWVIAPKKFEAYFCGGECNFPLGSRMNATNHAIVQTLMHLKQPNLPKPCCVPTTLGSISILHYLNEDSVNLSKFPNSVAKSCGCL